MKILFVDHLEILVSDQDYDSLKDLKFCWSQQPNGNYYIQYCKKGKCSYIHRMIMNPPKGKVVDHINKNTLDNRRSNLRICTQQNNTCNQKLYKSNTSGYKGVIEEKDGRKKKWRAEICCKKIKYYVGSFYNLEEAAKAYDKKALELFGEFAVFNFPNDIV